MNGAATLELMTAAPHASAWPSLEPLSPQQAADVADYLRASRQGRATDLLMGRLGLRQVVPLQLEARQ